MIKYLTIFCIFIIVSQYVFANNIDLLNEYKLLHLDLSNINTWGYKSHFDIKNNKASASINISQGTLKATGNVTDFAIMGHGFLKIRLENDMPGYTRSGNFVIDSYGNFVTLKHNYSLFDNINFPQMFLPNTLKITRDGNVFIKTVDEKGNLTEIDVGKILLHYIPSEYLIHYKDSIYILCTNATDHPKMHTNYSSIVQGTLEMGNIHLLPAILRMYYILSMIDEGYITNIEFKKRLLRIQINKMANNSVQEDLLLSIVGTVNDIYNLLAEKMNNTNEVFSMDNFRELDHRRFTNRALQEQMFERFLVNRVYFLTSILPYLKYNQ